jgi:hypothetical protein
MLNKIKKSIKWLFSCECATVKDDYDNIIVRSAQDVALGQDDIDFIRKHYPYSWLYFFSYKNKIKTETCCKRFGKYCYCNTTPQDFLFLMSRKEKNVFEDNCEAEEMLKHAKEKEKRDFFKEG